jgi:integrase
VVTLPDGTTERISGTPAINKQWAALRAEEDHVRRLLDEARNPRTRKEAPTLDEWFFGRYWTEWCVGQLNKPGTLAEKRSIFEHHLRESVGHLRLDEIDVGKVQELKASLDSRSNRYKKPLALKTRNNIIAVLAHALNYAEEAGVLDAAPRVRPFKFQRPEIETLDFDEWPRMLEAAAKDGQGMHAACLLAGEAGLRLGEILALRWEDLDLVAGRLTVCRQLRKGFEGTPKGGRRRVVPLTSAILSTLKSLPQVRRGRVICTPNGEPVAEAALKHGIYRVCRRAGLPERGWHALRHSFATHLAHFGVNPWRLQAWLGHSTINMTMRYVHHVEEHYRSLPEEIAEAGRGVLDPDQRVLVMLAARTAIVRGKGMAKTGDAASAVPAISNS